MISPREIELFNVRKLCGFKEFRFAKRSVNLVEYFSKVHEINKQFQHYKIGLPLVVRLFFLETPKESM